MLNVVMNMNFNQANFVLTKIKSRSSHNIVLLLLTAERLHTLTLLRRFLFLQQRVVLSRSFTPYIDLQWHEIMAHPSQFRWYLGYSLQFHAWKLSENGNFFIHNIFFFASSPCLSQPSRHITREFNLMREESTVLTLHTLIIPFPSHSITYARVSWQGMCVKWKVINHHQTGMSFLDTCKQHKKKTKV